MATNPNPSVIIGGSTASVGSPISITGAGSNNGVLTVSNGTGITPTWTASNTAKMTAKGQMHLEGPNADLVINDQSLSDWMQAVNKRLSILQPRPELQEKYEALQAAYDHYKTLESLLYDDQEPNK